ncbi:hypothetical protein GGR57DRAFT_54191 [Xylariaceae sp. FL1272]|nr:hypothetical protein GGR57DRAFT_54191 [Xylariaceae sp. FL1272]
MAESTLSALGRPFEALATTPIADLSPDLLDSTSRAVRGVVTITWPYNSVRHTFAFILAEPDFRLRRNKGQVRVDFTGRAAKVVGDSALASNDEVLLSLDGVAWKQKETNKRQSLPGSESGWKLSFSDRLSLQITRAETGTVDVIHVEETPGSGREPTPVPFSSITRIIPSSPPLPAPLSPPIRFSSPIRDPIPKKLSDGEFASPAFIKRARMSYGSLFEGGFDIFDDDGGAEGRGRKRTKFGRDSSAWRYASHSPSPEPPAASADRADHEEMDEVTTPHPQATMSNGDASASLGLELSEKRDASPRAETIDEGCQTMEMDLPAPEPASSGLHANELEPPAETTETLRSGGTNVTQPDAEAHPDDTLPDVAITIAPVPVVAEVEISQNLPPESQASVSTAPEPAHPTSGSDPPHTSLGSSAYPSFEFGSLRPDYAVNPWHSIAPSPAPGVLKSSLVSHPATDPFSSSVFGASTSIGQPLPFSTLGDLRTQPHPEDNIEYTGPVGDVENDTKHSLSALSDYPPLDGVGDTQDVSVLHDALSDYPVSYLEVAQENMSQQHDSSAEHNPDYTDPPAVSSWATINTTSMTHAVPATESYATSDGTTPEQALVIDDSDSEDGSVSQTAAAKQGSFQGHDETRRTYEDVDDEVDRDLDQRYSEEEVEEDEYESGLGDDYDTRVYEQPADDEDDEDDDDLRPHSLEPEFGEEEYSDEDEEDEMGAEEIEEEEEAQEIEGIEEEDVEDEEEEEGYDEEDEEDEGEYEMDYEVPHPAPPSHVQSQPMVIDLISSSEDEGDDDDENLEPDPKIQQSQLSPEFGEPVNQTRSRHGPSDHSSPEGEFDENQAMASDLEEDRSDRLSVEEGTDADENHEQQMEEERVEVLDEVKENEEENEHYDKEEEQDPEDPASLEVDRHAPPATHAVPEPEKIHIDISSPVASAQVLSQEEVSETVTVESKIIIYGQEEQSLSNPVTAADGLEMLTRIVENESKATSPSVLTQQTTTQVTVELSEDQPLSPQPIDDNKAEVFHSDHERDEQLETTGEDESIHTNLGSNDVNLVAPSPCFTEHYQPSNAQKLEAPTIGTFSPPASQSFQSLLEESSSTAPAQEIIFDIDPQTAARQLLTPLETQITEIAPSVGSPVASPTDTQSVEQQVFGSQDGEIVQELPDDLVQHEALMSMDVDVVDEDEVITSEKQQEQEQEQERSHEEGSTSPALSVESQLDRMSPDAHSEQNDQSHRSVTSAFSPIANTSYDSLMELDDELQASILAYSQPDNASGDEVPREKDVGIRSQIDAGETIGEALMEDAEEDMSPVDSTEESRHSVHAQQASDEAGSQITMENNEAYEIAQSRNDVTSAPTMAEQRQELQVEIPTNTSIWPERSQKLEVEIPLKRVPNTISAQLQRNFIEEEDDHAESKTLAQNDPSVHLARAANAAKRSTKSHHSPVNENRPHTRAFSAHRSPTPDVEDASANLARASFNTSFNSQPPKEEDSYTMTAVKLDLCRHLRDKLPDCVSLKVLRQHLTKSLDVIAVAVMEPSEPRRAKSGPREFIMSFTVTDHSIGPHAVVEVRISRPHLVSLPEVKSGDVVLLRNFQAISLAKKGFGLKSKKEGSSWAVFDRENEPAQIKGPPVEYGKSETHYVNQLRQWSSLLDEKARDKLETVNQKMIEKSK